MKDTADKFYLSATESFRHLAEPLWALLLTDDLLKRPPCNKFRGVP